MSETPSAPGEVGGPTPAKMFALLTPIVSSDTRVVVDEPTGVTSRSSPFSNAKLPLA